MTFVDGVPVESLAQYSQDERNRVITLLFGLLFRELFEFKLVQTDPNFANYMYNTESKQLVLLDFGACRNYSERFSLGYKALFSAALASDNTATEQALSDIGFFSQHIVPSKSRRYCS